MLALPSIHNCFLCNVLSELPKEPLGTLQFSEISAQNIQEELELVS